MKFLKIFFLIFKLIILLILLILAFINIHTIKFNYLPGQEVQWPLIAVMFLMFVIGALFGIFAMFGRILRLRSENNRLRHEVQKTARLATQDIAAPSSQILAKKS